MNHIALGKLDRFIGFRLRRVQSLLSRDFAIAAAALDLRAGHFTCLGIIAANPAISQNELARIVGLDPSATVQMIDELERRGFARRERSTVDRRRHALFLTPAGEAHLDELIAILGTVEQLADQVFTSEERERFLGDLDRLYRAAIAREFE